MLARTFAPRTSRVAPAAAQRPRAGRGVGRAPVVSVRAALEVEGTAQFEAEVLKSDKPVLVKFWATWCGPCKLVAPLVDAVEKEFGDHIKVVSINHTPNPEIISMCKVYGLPALQIYKDGQIIEASRHEGAITKALLQKYIEKHVLATVTA